MKLALLKRNHCTVKRDELVILAALLGELGSTPSTDGVAQNHPLSKSS